MHPSELRAGDIICFHTKNEVPEHVGMYTGMIDGKHYVTHEVTNGKPGLQSTILKNIGRMDIFRPKNAELGERAAKRLLQWAKYHIPYDVRRRERMINISDVLKKTARREDKEEPIDYLLKEMIRQAQMQFYSRIKYAARRDTCPVKMLEGTAARGWHCVQAVILAYQVEELAPYVKTLAQVQTEIAGLATTVEQIKETWISDKHCPEEILETYDLPDSYVAYADGLRNQEEFPDFYINDKRDVTLTHPHYHPCLVAWDYAQEPSIDAFIKKFDSCLNLPAKFCFTDSLFAFMKTNPQHWEYLGLLNRELLPKEFSEEEKESHRRRMSDLDLEITASREMIFRARTLSSPGLSVSPFSPRYASTHSAPASGRSTPAQIVEEIGNSRGMFRRISSLGLIPEDWQESADSPGEGQFIIPSPLLDRQFSKKTPGI